MNFDELPDPAPLEDMATCLRVTPRTLRRRLREVPYVRVGRTVLFFREHQDAARKVFERKPVSQPAAPPDDARELARQQIAAARAKKSPRTQRQDAA